MHRRKRMAAIVAGATTAAGAILGAGILLAPTAGAQDAPDQVQTTQGEALWTNPDTQAARWVSQNSGDHRAQLIDERIAQTPAGTWFTQTNPTGGIEAQVSQVVSAAASAGAAPTMVVYNIPNRDCGGASGGGASSHAEYRGWIDRIASQLSGPAYIVLEPDVLPHDCYDSGEQAQVNASMSYAAQTLKAADSQVNVYIDIGHSNWLAPAEAGRRLNAAGIANADGFALNTSNYRTTEEATGYAHQIQGTVGSDKAAVIDTSRNGNGPLGDEWCDPQGRAIGDYPTTSTGVNGIDAYLWVKLPGEADGCAGGAGQFIADLAYSMADAAGSDWPGDVVTDPPTDEPTTDEPTEDPTTDEPTDEPTTGGPGGEDCTAELVIVNQWNGGWQADVHVTAGAQSLNGWTLTWTWPGNQSISSSWNTDLTQSGQSVTASDVGWNGSIAASDTRNAFGFIGSGSSATPTVECSA